MDVQVKKHGYFNQGTISGIILLLVLLLVAYKLKCEFTAILIYIFYVISIIAVGLIFPKEARKNILNVKDKYYKLKFFGVFAVISALVVYNPVERYKNKYCEESIALSVVVKEKKGKVYHLYEGEGKVVLEFKDIYKAEINSDGTAFFPRGLNIHTNDKVKLGIEYSEPVQPVYPDSEYIIPYHGTLNLLIHLDGINHLSGTVTDEKNNPLSDVNVKIDQRIDTLTDSTGYYTFNIPDSLENTTYEVTFIKKGYSLERKVAYPQSKQKLNIKMSRQ